MKDMSPEEMRDFVAHNRFGLLGLAKEGNAYTVPLFYGYDGRTFYFHTHPGMKSEFIDATKEACFTLARIQAADIWGSVEAFGKVEEVADASERTVALDALMSVPLPPEFSVEPLRREPEKRFGNEKDMKLYKLTPDRMTGRKSEPPESPEDREIAFGGM